MDIKISEKRLNELEDIEQKLLALESGGVDNWEDYNVSLESYFKQKGEQEKITSVIEEVILSLCEGIVEPAGSGCGFGVLPESLHNAENILSKFMAKELVA